MGNLEILVKTLKRYNRAYRNGIPLVSDHEYDSLVEELRDLDPAHPFLASVEPEKFTDKIEIRHPVPMLSTEKAYTNEDLERFLKRVKKASDEIQITDLRFKITPKLDGLAGRDDGTFFTTRGNGEVGYEISSSIEKGVIPVGGRGLGLGEIVISNSYFQEHLSDNFEHPRNMVAGIIASDNLNSLAKQALENKVVVFIPYSTLPTWEGKAEDLIHNIGRITSDLASKTDYPIDGMVVEVTNDALKEYMGATSHHYRWQIAFKTRGETSIAIVEDIKWQVGRTGNVTPVMEINPVSLSGATIKRVTAHNAGLIKKKRIGPGAEIEIIRSGEVIPKLEKVIKESDFITIPEECPECGKTLSWSNDFLKCDNRFLCSAQIEQRINHWFKTLGNTDWFGIKTINKIVTAGFDSLEKIYEMDEKQFIEIGFGPVQSKNLANAIQTSKTKAIDDWRFLAAFGISGLGKGDSRKIIEHFKMEELINAKSKDIMKIHGFGEITSELIENDVSVMRPTITHMMSLGFNIDITRDKPVNINNRISGKGIVFTGKMIKGPREDMQAEARRLGAIVQSSVSGRTDLLVCGESVGASKIKKAEKTGALIISENEYYDMIKG